LEGIRAFISNTESGTISSVTIIRSNNRDISVIREDCKIISTKGLILTSLISCLNGESEFSEASVSVISTSFTNDMERSVLDVVTFEGNVNLQVAGLLWGIRNRVGSVVVVDDMDWDFSFGVGVNLDDERVTAVHSSVSVVVDGMDGEAGWLVIEDFSESFSLSVALVWIARPLDLGVEWGVLDGGSVKVDSDVVFSRDFDSVFDIVGSVLVIGELVMDVLWASNLDFEGIISSFDWVSITVDSVDPESAWLLGLSVSETVTLGPAPCGVGILHQRVERASLDVLAVEEDIDGVPSGDGWSVLGLVFSVVGVVELAEQWGSVWSGNVDAEGITSGWDGATSAIPRFDDERSWDVDP